MLCPSSKKRKKRKEIFPLPFQKELPLEFLSPTSKIEEKGFLNLSSTLRRFGEKGGRDKETKRRAVLSNNRSNDRWTNFGSVKNGGEGWENAGCQAIPYWSFNESTTLSRNPPRVASSQTDQNLNETRMNANELVGSLKRFDYVIYLSNEIFIILFLPRSTRNVTFRFLLWMLATEFEYFYH